MEFKNYLKEFASLKDNRANTLEQIKKRNMPIIVFGAARGAKVVTDALNDIGLEVFGYAVDDEYYGEGEFCLGKPVYRFSELRRQPDKYVFVLGMDDSWYGGRRAMKFMNDNSVLNYSKAMLTAPLITYNYIYDHQDKFSETYDLFQDSLSQETMIEWLKANISADLSNLKNFFDPKRYFNELTVELQGIRGGGGGIWTLVYWMDAR